MKLFETLFEPIFGETWSEVTSYIGVILVVALLIALIVVSIWFKNLKLDYELARDVANICEKKYATIKTEKEDLEKTIDFVKIELEKTKAANIQLTAELDMLKATKSETAVEISKPDPAVDTAQVETKPKAKTTRTRKKKSTETEEKISE